MNLGLQLRSIEGLQRCLNNQKEFIEKGFSASMSVALDLEVNKGNPEQIQELEESVLAYASMEREVVQLLQSVKHVQTQLRSHPQGDDDVPDMCGWMEAKLASLQQANSQDNLEQHEKVVEFREKIHGDMEAAGSAKEDPDADILLSQVEISLKCPLTQKILENPVQHRVCKHNYSKQAIIQYIKDRNRLNKAARCPFGGCGRNVAEKDLKANYALQGQIEKQRRRRV